MSLIDQLRLYMEQALVNETFHTAEMKLKSGETEKERPPTISPKTVDYSTLHMSLFRADTDKIIL